MHYSWGKFYTPPPFSRLFDEAVEVDPFWSKTEDGRYRCKKGALHDTPEKLVAAYRARDPASRSTKK